MNTSRDQRGDTGSGSASALTHTPTAGVSAGRVAIAAALAEVAALLLRFLLGVTTPTEIVGDRLTLLIPAPVFDYFLRTFDGTTKHLYFVGLLFGEAVVLWASALLYLWVVARWQPQRISLRSEISDAASVGDAWPGWMLWPVLAAALFVITVCLVAPLVGGGFAGMQFPGGAAQFLVSLVVLLGLDALFLTWLVPVKRGNADRRATRPEERRIHRRTLLRQGAQALTILALGSIGYELLADPMRAALGLGTSNARYLLPSLPIPAPIKPAPVPTYTTWATVPGQTNELTPTADFYYVSKNIAADPQVNGQSWSLTIDGTVSKPYTLSLSDLRALPKVQRYQTLECISNEVGGNLMSTALWTGVSIASLLERAGPLPAAREMIFTGADDYSDSLHLAQALDPRTLLVYEINGEPLPVPHGYPARLLVPGLYGMKNGKWVTRLTLGPGGYTGYWEQRDWSHEAVVKLTSRIDTPHNQDFLAAGPTSVAGVAFAGAEGVAQVQVSLDAGKTWQVANLYRPRSNLTWVLWEYSWQATPGAYVVAVRAVDLRGNVQTPATEPPIPNGATGYDAIAVTVR